MALNKGDNLVALCILLSINSDLIRGVAFAGSGFIRGTILYTYCIYVRNVKTEEKQHIFITNVLTQVSYGKLISSLPAPLFDLA